MLVVLSGKPVLDATNPWAVSLLSSFRECVADGDASKIADPSIQGEISSSSLRMYVEIVENCLQLIPKNRPTVAQVVSRLEQTLEQHHNHHIQSSSLSHHDTKNLISLPRKVIDPETQSQNLIRITLTREKSLQPRGKDSVKLRNALFGWLSWYRREVNIITPTAEQHTDPVETLPVCSPANHDTAPQEILPIDATAFSLDELNKLRNNVETKSVLGKDYYGLVDVGTLSNGQKVAIKKLDMSCASTEPHSVFNAKVSTFSRLKHENLVQLLGYCFEGNHRILTYEYATMGSLDDVLYGLPGGKPGPVLSWNQRVKIAFGTAKALRYLHEEVQPPIIHGRVKSRNVLLFDDFVAKVADINLGNQPPECPGSWMDSTNLLANYAYHPPEYTMEGRITEKFDVYSFGVVLLELLTGRKPVDCHMPRGQQSLVTWATPKLDRVKKIMDPKLNKDYPPKAAAKVFSTILTFHLVKSV
ncbi:OLC1v1030296C4 [Oldenlandia corymbosa var. corymbosa]|uniref:OLC1v1030296C4 n=1 Tax=Oldenlandia corymbosa var. corymbosa TaxID=529605 RepID=A0AAV1CGI3_OLDCO|nr:OLC1v1030296C4 [Oldenlandia corymbosa var. corymbosa]